MNLRARFDEGVPFPANVMKLPVVPYTPTGITDITAVDCDIVIVGELDSDRMSGWYDGERVEFNVLVVRRGKTLVALAGDQCGIFAAGKVF